MMKTTDFATHLSKFLAHYLPNERGSSLHTIDSYRNAFVLYLTYMESIYNIAPEKICIKDFTRESIIGYLNWLETDRNNCISTRNSRLSAMKGFIHYLKYELPDYMEEYQKILSIPLKKGEKKEISYLKTDGIKLLVKQINLNKNNGLRDYVMIMILYTTGIRVSELINIKVKDISMNKPYSIKIHGKGNKGRIVPIVENTIPYIQKYLSQMQYNEDTRYDEYLFKNHMNQQFTRQGINHILKKYGDMARTKDETLIPKDLTAHKIRHTTAMELLTSGVELLYIRDLLGHESIITTEIYAKTDSQLKRSAIEAASKEILPEEKALWENNTNLLKWLKSYGKSL